MWKFDQKENAAAITDYQVLEKKFPILIVIHYSDDHSWAFISGQSDLEKDGRVVSMKEIVEMDHSLESICNLEPGYVATRRKAGDVWNIEKDEDM